ncbi:MAG TPA: polysaccharide biosynthesis/export family protein [Pirellulales bacterium]|jgi:polysaccharide export outer membrane protein
MSRDFRSLASRLRLALLLVVLASCPGCRTWSGLRPVPAAAVGAPCQFVPTEKNMVSLPPYMIEPPDILLIDALRIIPKEPFQIQPLDVLQVDADPTTTKLDNPIRGLYLVEPGGMLNLGPAYGKVKVGGQSLEEAQAAVLKQLRRTLKDPQVSLSLNESGGQQQIAGEHLVGPDGTINLGTYGQVYVAGLTISQATEAIEKHLTQYLDAPLVAVDIYAYNSKVYYVVTQGAGFGDNIQRFPVTGNETVLDAISQVQGLSRLSSKNIWIARPSPAGCDQILPVRWDEITQGGGVGTNYQVLPGDRIYVGQDHMIALDSFVNKMLNPIERIFGTSLLGIQTVQNARSLPNTTNF